MNTSSMKALVCTKYGSPEYLQVQRVAIPEIGENELLIQIFASPITAADTMMRRATPFISRFFLGFFKPRRSIVGTGFSGKVIKVGKAVTRFRVGEEVFGETGLQFSANAEYISIAESAVVVHKPSNLSFGHAAVLCDGPLTSYHFLRHIVCIQAGQKILVNGASGSLGSAAVQIAKYYKAEVTGICSGRNTNWVKEIGADKIINYQEWNISEHTQTYDIIFDSVGKLSYCKSEPLLRPEGVYLTPVISISILLQMIGNSFRKGKRAILSAVGLLPPLKLRSHLNELLALIQQGKLIPFIEKYYPMEQAVEGHRYVDSQRKRGNVLIKMR